ncbi:MAG TPA: hypothetical protein VFT14_05045 [Solirubrobacterales bacterium]|nr:hypothetical protein [Solirubrobacterales bacterium]
MATALRYVDLVLLVAALPVFIAADLPMAGYIVVAAVWIAQHGIEIGAERAASRAVAKGDRRAAMGWIGATTLARVWIVALAVLLVGLISSEDAGLAAAVLAAILFTVHFGGRLLARLFAPEEGVTRGRSADARARDSATREMSGERPVQ